MQSATDSAEKGVAHHPLSARSQRLRERRAVSLTTASLLLGIFLLITLFSVLDCSANAACHKILDTFSTRPTTSTSSEKELLKDLLNPPVKVAVSVQMERRQQESAGGVPSPASSTGAEDPPASTGTVAEPTSTGSAPPSQSTTEEDPKPTTSKEPDTATSISIPPEQTATSAPPGTSTEPETKSESEPPLSTSEPPPSKASSSVDAPTSTAGMSTSEEPSSTSFPSSIPESTSAPSTSPPKPSTTIPSVETTTIPTSFEHSSSQDSTKESKKKEPTKTEPVTSSAVLETKVSTLPGGSETTITSTSWVDVEPATTTQPTGESSEETSSPDLQDAASTLSRSRILSIGVATAIGILLAA